MGKMITIPFDGDITEKEVDKVTLEEVQEAVQGYIEFIPYFNRYNGETCQAICNEEGKLEGMMPNKRATDLWIEQVGNTYGDYLVGDVIILTGSAMLD